MTQVLLTDDELVALAVRRGSYWPGPMPTVDADDADALKVAAMRGVRSFRVRELSADSLLELAGAGIGCATHVSVYLGNDEFVRTDWGIATTHYPTEGGWLVESVSVPGVHRFAVVTDYENSEAIAALAGIAFTTASAGSEPDAWLCIAAVTPESARLAAVRGGQVRYGTVANDRILDEGMSTDEPGAAILDLVASIR